MKATIKIICFISVLALMFTCFAGCGKDETSSVFNSNKKDDPVEPIIIEDYDEYDLAGVTLLVALGHESILFPDEDMDELSARRKKWIENDKSKYNFELEHVYYKSDKMADTLLPELISGKYVADMVLPVVSKTGRFIQAGVCYDLLTEEFVKYLDFSTPWWDDTMLRASTIDGKVYCCAPQFTWAANNTWVCFFNRTLMEELEVDPDSLYDMQEHGTWTWNKFMELGKKAVKDIDGNGIMNAKDRYAFGSEKWSTFNNLITAAGIDFAYETGGILKCDLFNAKNNNILLTLNKMFTGYGMYFDTEKSKKSLYDIFANDQLLFAFAPVSACSNDTITNMKSDFGMVLTPRYSEDQDYISRADQNSVCCFIPVTANYKLETAFVIQALSYKAWQIGVPDIMELNYAQYVRDDGSEYCIYEVFNHTTFTVDLLLLEVGTKKTLADIIYSDVMMPIVTQANVDIADIQSVATQCQTLLDDFYGQATDQK